MFTKYIDVMFTNSDNRIIEFATREIETDECTNNLDGYKLATYSVFEETLRDLTGRMLTIIDAAIPSGTQNKCIKDLIRKEFLNEFELIASMMLDEKISLECQQEAEIVSAKEALGA